MRRKRYDLAEDEGGKLVRIQCTTGLQELASVAELRDVTSTAFGPMLVVAVEQFTPATQRIVDDRLARRFLPSSSQLVIAACRWKIVRRQLITWSERRFPGLWGSLLCRKRYGDDQFAKATSNRAIQQVVVLGAGLDDRAYRSLGSQTPLTFEVDLPANSEYKRRRLVALCDGVPERVKLVPLDFEATDLGAVLMSQGFRQELATLFVWEAVTQYLTESAVRRTLAFLSQATAGSRLIFTYVQRDFLDGSTRWQCPALYDQFVGRKRLWHFGLRPSDVTPLLDEYGWSERGQVGEAEYRRRYIEPLGRRLALSDIERFVAADKR